MAEVIDAALATAGKKCDLGNDPAKYLERFEEWYEHTSLLADAIGIKDSAQKLRLMLLWGGQDFRKTVKEAHVILEGDGKDTLDQAIEKIRTQCSCHVNSTMAMYKLMHVQQGTKTFTQFAREVEELATQCQFDTVPYTKERPMKDAIIFSTSDDKLRKEDLAKDVDLTTLTKTALGYEQSWKSCGTMKTTGEPIQCIDTPSTYTQEQVDQIVACIMAGKYSSWVKDKDKSTKPKECPNCPSFYKPHEPNRCPEKGKTCVVCKEKHHFAGFMACKATTIKSVTKDPNTEAYQFPQAPAPTTGIHKLEVTEIHCLLPEDTHNMTQLTVNQHGIEFFLDSGCHKTLLPLQLYQPTMGPLQPSQTKFHPYSTTSYLPIAGQLPASLQTCNGTTHSTTIYVMDGHHTEPLLGDTDAKALGILTINRDGYTKEHKETGQHTKQVAGITSNLRAAGITINSNIT